MATGPEHYREAERLLAQAHIPPSKRAVKGWCTADELIAAGQVHATLALAAATVEGSGLPIQRPMKADPEVGDSAYPGNPWGRAFYGDLKDGNQ